MKLFDDEVKSHLTGRIHVISVRLNEVIKFKTRFLYLKIRWLWSYLKI